MFQGLGIVARRRFVNLTWFAFVAGIEIFAVAALSAIDAAAGMLSETYFHLHPYIEQLSGFPFCQTKKEKVETN